MNSLRLIERLQNHFYPAPGSRDPVLQFMRMLYDFVEPTSQVLDIGAGAGEKNVYKLKGRCREIIGVDLDSRVASNPLLDKGLVADVERLPFERGSFDVVFSICVLEHIEKPRKFVAEVKRVLRPGGHFLTLVPNQFHYVTFLSKMTPLLVPQMVQLEKREARVRHIPDLLPLEQPESPPEVFRGGRLQDGRHARY